MRRPRWWLSGRVGSARDESHAQHEEWLHLLGLHARAEHA